MKKKKTIDPSATDSAQSECTVPEASLPNVDSVSSPSVSKVRKSAFNELGFQATIVLLQEEIRSLYVADDIPWILGYSGGKDSTATLQLIWSAISELQPEQRRKAVYAISTDTMVENPVVASWVANSLAIMKTSATLQDMPIQPRRLTPSLADSFWVNLIGKGYPAPRHKFRWCTARLKISPSNTFINSIVSSSGEAILVLGTRKAESSARAANMARHEKGRVRDRLSPNSSLPGSLVYSPIEDWTNDDVWFYLMQVKNPWGYNNRDLLGMYAGASADGECPLVVDDSTQSCGSSRFGCWVCTLVDKDKSMTAMIQNDEEKEWMMPLLDIRNALDFRRDHKGEYAENADYDVRDFRRMSGAVQVMPGGRPIPGPYIQISREGWLRQLLIAQTYIRKNGPTEVKGIELITLEELQEIRRIWVVDKHELEDSLPRIYREATGTNYPGRQLDDNLVMGEDEMNILAELCGDERFHYELCRELLSVTLQQRSTSRRSKHHEKLEKVFSRHFYDNREDAISRAQLMADQKRHVSNDRMQYVSVVMESQACDQEGDV